MSAAAILAIVVATSDAQDPATAIMLGAAVESLGPAITVRLIDANDPATVDPLRIERDLGAGAVVTVVWRDATRLRARILLHVAAGGASTTRELVFSASDTRAERGRTLGLTAGSMWPEILAAERGRPPGRGPPAAVTAERSVPGPGAAIDAKPESASRTQPAPAQRDRREEHAAPESPESIARARHVEGPPVGADSGATFHAARRAIGIAGVGATGIGGPAGGLGARLEGMLPVAASWSLRIGLSLRTGAVPDLPGGSDVVVALAGGVEWWPAALRLGRAVSLGVRADALALRHQVSGAVLAGQTENRGRLLPGFDLLAQALLRVGARIELLAAGGSEVAVGATEIRSGSTRVTVATIPALRLTGEIGVRVGF
jgi:hypothetical protein